MERADVLVRLLGEEIRSKLGDEYQVNQNFLSASIERADREPASMPETPDLVVWNRRERVRPFIVEVKLYTGDSELPLTTASQMVLIREANRIHNPVLILATNAKIGKLLRAELTAQDIEVVQSKTPGLWADSIAKIIRAKEANSNVQHY